MASSAPAEVCIKEDATDLEIKFSVSGDFRKDPIASAYIGKMRVGDFRFRPEATSLKAVGTFIELKYQKKGVATALWNAVIKKYNPQYISVSTTSPGGNNLVLKLRKLHPAIEWDHW